jgi:hypothetical protein
VIPRAVTKEDPLFDEYTTRTLRESLKLVQYAHRLLAAPERWTQEVWARDRAGNEVPAGSITAVSWCVGGAILCANVALYPARGAIDIPLDLATSEAAQVRGPKRVVAALQAVGEGLLHTSHERIKASPPPPAARGERTSLAKQHPTLRASDINDLPLIAHPHVVLGVAHAMVQLHDEIQARSEARRLARGSRSRG